MSDPRIDDPIEELLRSRALPDPPAGLRFRVLAAARAERRWRRAMALAAAVLVALFLAEAALQPGEFREPVEPCSEATVALAEETEIDLCRPAWAIAAARRVLEHEPTIPRSMSMEGEDS